MKKTYSTVALILTVVSFIMIFVSCFINGLSVMISLVSFLFFTISGMIAKECNTDDEFILGLILTFAFVLTFGSILFRMC